MDDITRLKNNSISSNEISKVIRNEIDLVEVTEEIVCGIRIDSAQEEALSMPIAELATLGAGVSSLIPALRTVIQTTTVDTQGLFRLANAEVGDALKVARNGNFWGAFKTAEGTSKFAQLKAAGPLSVSSTTVMPIDPATIMMAVALFSIEQQLRNITEVEKRILAFLEIEKESEVEADVETLLSIISQFKFNWDNEHFISSNHKMVLDIQRTARKNMISYQKKVAGVLEDKQQIIAQAKVDSALKELQKKFKYYRLSLYTFSMASFIEIMLSGNFKEENITGVKEKIEKFALDYRNLFTQCSVYLEKMINLSVETNILKGLGVASDVVGKFIGSIPIVRNGPVDELLQDGGTHLKKSANGIEKNIVASFAEMRNPEISVFVEKMNDLIRIYNYTEEICFDEKKIYLISG